LTQNRGRKETVFDRMGHTLSGAEAGGGTLSELSLRKSATPAAGQTERRSELGAWSAVICHRFGFTASPGPDVGQRSVIRGRCVGESKAATRRSTPKDQSPRSLERRSELGAWSAVTCHRFGFTASPGPDVGQRSGIRGRCVGESKAATCRSTPKDQSPRSLAWRCAQLMRERILSGRGRRVGPASLR
jgi:hypothetical protein